MILIINDEIKIQGKPSECIEFLKKYNEEFKEDIEISEIIFPQYNHYKYPGISFNNTGCENCLYYIQKSLNPDSELVAGDTPCTFCPKMMPRCVSGLTDPR